MLLPSIAAPCGNTALFTHATLPIAGALYEGRGTYGDVITYSERLFGRIRQAVACQAAPTTLKAAFLDPVADSMATEVALELFAKADADFMHMFTGNCWTTAAFGGTFLSAADGAAA